jgi:GxxExxY protein
VNVFTTNREQQTSMFKKKPMPLINKEIWLDHGYGMDLLVDNKLVVEIKTVEVLSDIHLAQMLTYLKLGDFKLGLLVNFHVSPLKNELRRVINSDNHNL